MKFVQHLPATLAEIADVPRPILDDFTVFIPTLGRPLLEKVLISIVTGTVWPTHLILVDQGTNLAVATWAKTLCKLGIKTEHIKSPRRGAGAARNRGIERIITKFAAATDDDCVVDPEWLQSMADQLHQHPTAVITGRVEPGSDEEVPSTITSTIPVVYNKPQFKGDPLYTGNMGFALETAAHIGPFDEDMRLFPVEDCDWGYRALKAGISIRYSPEVVVVHLGWRDAEQRATLYRRYARAMGFYYGKHLRRADWFIALRIIIATLRAFRRWLRGILTSNHDLTAHGRAFMAELPPGIIAGIRGEK